MDPILTIAEASRQIAAKQISPVELTQSCLDRVKRLDDTIRATIPGLHYAVKWKRPYYGLPELGWIIEMAAYDVSVNVVFLGGADFESPPPLGTTDRTRYIKVTTLEEAQRPELHKWIEEASRTPGWT